MIPRRHSEKISATETLRRAVIVSSMSRITFWSQISILCSADAESSILEENSAMSRPCNQSFTTVIVARRNT